MRLKEGKNGRTYTVEEIHIELNLERRLEALGLTQGSQITILNNDKKGALTVRFRGTRFALGPPHRRQHYCEGGGSMSERVINVGFIGNPNCGKTTLFNAYTGANLKVANWPGVTVEKKEGKTFYKGQEFKLIDLPGIYSLTSYTMEEKVSRECIMSDEVDVIVDVADASCLERNLYLTLQLIELGKPVVLALNMMDVVGREGNGD